jgi:pyridinium-3,5-biscarboxylic acid mononucleotide sulfurtransferase
MLGERAIAVTGVSPSLAEGELENAVQVARQIGIRHEVIQTHEFDRPQYLRNHSDRCYHCKTELYTNLDALAERFHVEVVVNGANLDDAGDYRPGMRAATEHRVRSPLLECGLNKQDVRDLAASWELAVWDKPASPCLSSRVAYGLAVTPERLAMIDKAEQFLRAAGFRVVRVRYHEGDVARIEVPASELAQLIESPLREQLAHFMSEVGFKFVTLDLAGFRSGSMNSLVSLNSFASS